MATIRSRFYLSIAALAASPVFAQSLSAPVAGFIFDSPTQSLRAVNGFPGSATLGPPLLNDVEFGSPAPHQKYALAFRSGHALVANLGGTAATTVAISGVFGRPEDARWSEDGTHVTIFSRSAGWIQTISGMPHTPHANSHVILSALEGSLTTIAVDKPGKQIAIAMSGTSGGVYLNTQTQHFVPLAKMANPIALSFSDDGTIV